MTKHAERRSSLRRPIHHEAIMRVNSELTIPCIIADFCLDGMFIKFFQGVADRAVDLSEVQEAHSQIELSFLDEQKQTYTINAEVVHHISGACGLRFSKRFDTAVQTLVNLSVNSGLPAEHSLPVKTILTECIQFIHGLFGGLLEGFWRSLEEELRAEAVKANNDQTANAVMALAERVKQKQMQLQAQVMHGIDDPVSAFNAHLEKRKAMSDRLTIIDKHEFEDWLVSRVLVMRCEADYQSLLLPLKLRLDALGVGDKRHHQSVFGPALLVSAFQPVVQTLSLDHSSEKMVFKAFERNVMVKLTPLYEGLNAILVRHNILPKLSINKGAVTKQAIQNKTEKKPSSLETSNQEKSVSSGSSASSNPSLVSGTILGTSGSLNTQSNISNLNQSGSITPVQGLSSPSDFQGASNKGSLSVGNIDAERVFIHPPFSGAVHSSAQSVSFNENQQIAQSALSNISNLLKSLRSEASESPPEDASLIYTNEELEEGLTQLQASSESDEWFTSTKSLVERIEENLSVDGIEKFLDQDKKAAIDVVDRFFLSMRNNSRINTQAKQFLVKLEVPVLKVLLKNDQFFTDQQSSVRAVMNRIAQLGATGSNLNSASLNKITKLVQKIIDEFEHDTSVFDDVLDELNQLIERQNTIYTKNVQRVAASAEGTQKVEDANVAVTKAINARIAHKFVPSALITLINEGWREYLNLTFIKFGEESEEWNEGLSIIDRLIAFGDDPRIPIDVRVILPKIQEGLKLVSGTNEASTKVRDALKAFILNAPKGQHLSEQAQLLQIPETEEDLLSRNIHKSQELKDWILKIKNIPLGTWLKFSKSETDITYMRMVWVAKGYSKFVFVNHQGMKVVELGLFRLANYFKDGQIAIDANYEVPIFNQGLDDMVKDVYDKLAYESSHDVGTGLINRNEFCRQVRSLMKKGKRTSACTLLYIHFRKEGSADLTLPDGFANDIVKTLEEHVIGSILARLNEADFVVFSVVNDAHSYKSSIQEELINVCQRACYLDAGLIVTVGESRAHLGFNNPESMIEHALNSISHCFEQVEDGVVKIASEPSDSVDEDKDVPVLVPEAANMDVNEPTFEELNFEIWGQETSQIIQEIEANQSSTAKSIVIPSVHLNLVGVIHGESQPYRPDDFSNAIKLDRWWIDKLVYLQDKAPQLFDDYQRLRIKLSAYAFNDDELVERLVSLAHNQLLNAKCLCFDIYDCFEITDVEFASMRMNRLKNMSFSFCLDHFGSDRSPFAYLKALPVDMIKIDEAFIAGMSQTEGEEEVAADSIVEIAHYLGKKVLATEVDSAVCLQKMKHLKVDFVQGSTLSEAKKYDL